MALPFPEIDPVALSLGPLQIRWYALAYLAGFILGWRYAVFLIQKAGAKFRPNVQDLEDFLPWAVIGVILGGRLGYVFFYQFDFYMQEPFEILKIWQGGMAFHGGVLGVMAAILLFGWKNKISPFSLADIFCVAAPIGLFFGRIANFINGELYGRVSDVPWAFVFPGGGDQPRHPSQLYEAFFEGLVLLIILTVLALRYRGLEKPGLISGVFLIGYGIFRAGIEFFREPDIQIGYLFGFLTMGQILCVPMILFGSFMLFRSLKARS